MDLCVTCGSSRRLAPGGGRLPIPLLRDVFIEIVEVFYYFKRSGTGIPCRRACKSPGLAMRRDKPRLIRLVLSLVKISNDLLTNDNPSDMVLIMKAKLVLPQVSCKYGAPMGRMDNKPTEDHPAAMGTKRVHLQRMPLYQSVYDAGGAYWGCQRGFSMYWVHTEPTGEVLGIDLFIRALGREDAKKRVLVDYPQMKFYK